MTGNNQAHITCSPCPITLIIIIPFWSENRPLFFPIDISLFSNKVLLFVVTAIEKRKHRNSACFLNKPSTG